VKAPTDEVVHSQKDLDVVNATTEVKATERRVCSFLGLYCEQLT
jgi:hypothetical protein